MSQANPAPQPIPPPAPIQSRVMLLIYNPIIEQEGGRKLNQVLGWNDPDDLCRRYISDVNAASHGLVHYQIAQRLELDAYPLLEDGFQYTDAQFLRHWRARGGWHEPMMASYPAILRDANFLPRLDAGQVDELWAFGFPYAGFYESCMGGRGAIWCNGPIIPGTERVAKRFVVMGFNYERGVGEMLEDLGHRAENIMEHLFRDIPDAPPRHAHGKSQHRGKASLWQRLFEPAHEPADDAGPTNIDLSGNVWRQFIRYDQSHPGQAACGNVHFAPSSQSDYDWGNRRSVRSNADDWLNYPNFSGESREMRCDEWGNGDIRMHHIWWMQRFPHVAGETPTGKPNNWWGPIIDPNLIRN